MDEFEITCIVKDRDGTVSHCGVKGYGVQNVAIIEKLIKEETFVPFSFLREGIERGMYMQELPKMEQSFLTTDPNGLDINTLNFLPLFDKPLLKQPIESVR